MARGESVLTEDEATERAELLLGALDGLAFRWSLDTSFAFPDFARSAATRFG